VSKIGPTLGLHFANSAVSTTWAWDEVHHRIFWSLCVCLILCLLAMSQWSKFTPSTAESPKPKSRTVIILRANRTWRAPFLMVWANFEIAITIHAHPGYNGNPSYCHMSQFVGSFDENLLSFISAPMCCSIWVCALAPELLQFNHFDLSQVYEGLAAGSQTHSYIGSGCMESVCH
jgi:hypothetical protein